MLDVREQIERLRGYNTPDRTIDEQQQMSVDIHEAADTLEKLNAVYEAGNKYLEGELTDANNYAEFAEAIAAVEDE